MKTTISLSDLEFDLNEKAARRHNLKRSNFYAEAARHYRTYLDTVPEQGTELSAETRRINEVLKEVGQPDTSWVRTNANAVFETVEW